MGIDARFSELEVFRHQCRLLSRRRFKTERDIYEVFLSLVLNTMAGGVGFLHLFDETAEHVELKIWSTDVVDACVPLHGKCLPIEEGGIWADAIKLRSTVIENDVNAPLSERYCEDGNYVVERYMCAPLFDGARIVAVCGILNGTSDYEIRDARLLEEACAYGWPLVLGRVRRLFAEREQAARHFERMQPIEIVGNMLGAIGRALESRDEYTSHHQSNVAYISAEIAAEMQLDETTVFGLNLGALVHDIGKISIPSQILGKPGRLTPPEYDLLKTHAATGADFFAGLDMPWPIRDMILQHHERMDGSGYPEGLAGHDICLEARVIAVADTYDAMASDRPYRRTVGAAKAIEQIKRDRNRGLDPYVVDAFLRRCGKDPTFAGRYDAGSPGDMSTVFSFGDYTPTVLQ